MHVGELWVVWRANTPGGAALEEAGGYEDFFCVGEEATGYPPMSKDEDFARAGKNDQAPSAKSFSHFSNGEHSDNNNIKNSSILPSPLIPTQMTVERDADDPLSLLLPDSFEPQLGLVLPNGKKFFSVKIETPSDALRLAEKMIAYFSRPLSGWYTETIWNRDGSTPEVKKPYNAPLPLVAEFATNQGLTEGELKSLGRTYPDTIGRALEFAKDVVKTTLVRKGLVDEYDPRFAMFTAMNETDMRAKSEHTERHVDMNDLLDRIERANAPILTD